MSREIAMGFASYHKASGKIYEAASWISPATPFSIYNSSTHNSELANAVKQIWNISFKVCFNQFNIPFSRYFNVYMHTIVLGILGSMVIIIPLYLPRPKTKYEPRAITTG